MARTNVGVGLSLQADPAQAAREAVRSAMVQAGLTHAAWAVCFFSSAHLPRADLVWQVVLEESGCLALCGCSATGVIGRGQEVREGAALAVMVGASPGLEVRSAVLPESGEGLDRFGDPQHRSAGTPAVIALPDAFRVDNTRLQERLRTDLPATPVFGGGATDDGTLGISLQMGMEGVRSGSISMMGFYGNLELSVGITQSCSAVGDPHFITQADEFVLIELDGRSALHTYIEQGKMLGMDSMQQAVQDLLFGFPLNMEHPEFTGDSCVVRPLAGFDQSSKGLVIPYPMSTQTTLGFMHRDPAMAARDVRRMVTTLENQLSGTPDFGFYFDCAARGRELYGRVGVDLEAIHGQLGDFPLIGMFGGFELATAQGIPHVYTYTGVLVLVRAV